MRIWVQVFSSRERNPDFHGALEEHLRSIADPGVQIEVHGTRKGGLGEQFRFFQTIDTPDIIENILKCRAATGHDRYDAFISLNSTDPALIEAREILNIPVLGFLETTALVSCMMGRSFSLILLKMAETAVRIQQFMGTFVSRKMLYQMPGQVVRERAKQDYGIDLS
jgi:Asp/Glu/hydantoin racemase